MRGGHRYVRQTSRTYAPCHVMTCAPELSHQLGTLPDGDSYYWATAIWGMYGRRSGTRWSGDHEATRYHPDDWWDEVASVVRRHGRVYIVAPSAADLCTMSGFWARVDRGEYTLRHHDEAQRIRCANDGREYQPWIGRLVLGGPPDIVHMRSRYGTTTIVSMRNYIDTGWRDLDGYVSRECDTNRYDDMDRPCGEYDGHAQCVILTRYMRAIMSAWISEGAGPWRDTVAGLSVSYWKTKHYTQRICRHDVDDATCLEKAAAHGGRQEVWYYGDCGDSARLLGGHDVPPRPSGYPAIRGTIYRADISSQYPSIMATEMLPVRLMGVTDTCSVSDLRSILRYYGVIADVEIHTDRPEYPVRRGDRVVYPVGRVATTLAGPELQYALDRGDISRINRLARYEMGRPLSVYARHLLDMRADARAAGDRCGELLAKSLSTSICGKFTQRTTRRVAYPDVISPIGRWGPFVRSLPDGTSERYIAIAGMCYRDEYVLSGGSLLGAIYCYITSYGRMQMSRIRESMVPHRPYAQVTDGLWVGESALPALRRCGLSEDRSPGMMRLVSDHYYARWLTPAHYYIDGRWTLSGYLSHSRVEPDGVVYESRDINSVRSCPHKAPMRMRRKTVERMMVSLRGDVVIGDDGWMVPKVMRG